MRPLPIAAQKAGPSRNVASWTATSDRPVRMSEALSAPAPPAGPRYGPGMAEQPVVVLEVARGGAVDRQLRLEPPPAAASGELVIVSLPADSGGRLEPPDVGEIVMSLPAPEALVREHDELRRVIDGAAPGDEPVVVVLEAAEELREDELAAILDAARRSRRAVILRIIGDA
jgi:hypothetical protein